MLLINIPMTITFKRPNLFFITEKNQAKTHVIRIKSNSRSKSISYLSERIPVNGKNNARPILLTVPINANL